MRFFLVLLFLFASSISLLFVGVRNLFKSQNRIASFTQAPNPSQFRSPSASLSTDKETAIVKRVIDGDTVELADGRKVRYIGIDTPETVDPNRPTGCFGKEASNKNRELVLGKTVLLEKDVSEVDRYGRLLRYVYIDGEEKEEMINYQLVRLGFAHAVTFPPDIKYQDVFREAQTQAVDEGVGLWDTCANQNDSEVQAGNIDQKLNLTSSPQVFAAASTAPNSSTSNCLIKGNISTSGEKIYHLPGCGSYEKTTINEETGEHWFCTETEAQAAGFRKAKNC